MKNLQVGVKELQQEQPYREEPEETEKKPDNFVSQF